MLLLLSRGYAAHCETPGRSGCVPNALLLIWSHSLLSFWSHPTIAIAHLAKYLGNSLVKTSYHLSFFTALEDGVYLMPLCFSLFS